MWRAEKKCDAAKYRVIWEVYENNAWRAIDAANLLDSDTTISGNSITVDRWLMGAKKVLRCRVKYSESGSPESVELTDASPCANITITRRIPKYECDIAGAPYNSPFGTKKIAPSALIKYTNGELVKATAAILP